MRTIRKLSFLGILAVTIAVLFLVGISFVQTQAKTQKGKPDKPSVGPPGKGKNETWAVQIPTSRTMLQGEMDYIYVNSNDDILSKTPKINIDYGKIPLYFIPNKGQVDSNALFYAKASQYILWMTKEGLVFDSVKKTAKETQIQKRKMDFENHQTPFAIDHSSSYKRDVSRLIFLNANNNMEIVPVDMTAHRVNYFIGNEKSKWKRNIPTSKAVLYKEIYRNIDLKVYGMERQIECDWVVKPGGSPEDIRFEYKNVRGTRIDMEGKLAIKTEFGELIHKKPLSYQVIEGKKIEIGVEFKKTRKNTYGFKVQKFNTDYELIIDPLIYSTYIGGSLDDCGYGIAVDGSRNAYITGYTLSSGFPTTTGAYDNDFNGGDCDVFITKVNSTGTDLLYSTFLGGSGDEIGLGIAIDGSGNAYVTGWTRSTDYPTTSGAYDTEYHGGDNDIFVTKLNSSGNDLEYSTYLGTSYGMENADASYGIAVDGSGNAYITGYSRVFTYIGGVMIKHHLVLVKKLNSTGTDVLYSIQLGSVNDDSEGCGYGIAVDGSGNAYVTGYTSSWDFPNTSGCYDTYPSYPTAAFLSKIDSTGALLYSTYLGADGHNEGYGIAVDGSGNAYITGYTDASDFPTTTGAYDTSHNGDDDIFVTKIDPAGNGTNDLLYSTFLGGSGDYNCGEGIAVDGSGYAYVTGTTNSTDFPTTTDAYDTSHNGDYDIFVTRIDPAGNGINDLLYSTFLGGTDYDYGFGIAVELESALYVTGVTWSTDFPTTVGAYDTSSNGEWDAFLSKISSYVTLTISTSTGGTTDPSPGDYTYDKGTEVTITASPDTNYDFSHWTGDVPSGHENDNPVTVTMDEDKSIIANFSSTSTGDGGDGDSDTGGGGGCFIATACYGTAMAEEVKILSALRDRYLLPNPVGQAFVRFYYKYSPKVADFIRDNESLKAIVREFLKPIVCIVALLR